jgi:hypothetical protein
MFAGDVLIFYSSVSHRGPPHCVDEVPRVILFVQVVEDYFFQCNKSNYTADFQYYLGISTAYICLGLIAYFK